MTTSYLEKYTPGYYAFLGAMSSPRIGTLFWNGRRTSVADCAYSVVRNMDEIPLANRPRIVKLHGSLPSHFPLIFTEEDYRTYPMQFAPFVNTAQQAMMETLFCLIGFSR